MSTARIQNSGPANDFWETYNQSQYEYDYSKHYRNISGLGQYVGIHGERSDPLAEEPIVPAIPEDDPDLLNPIATTDQIAKIYAHGSKKSTISELELPVIKAGSKVKITTDFVEALDCGDTNGFLPLEDDFYLQAMMGESYDFEEDEQEYEEDQEDYEGMYEYEEDEHEYYNDDDDDEQMYKQMMADRVLYDDAGNKVDKIACGLEKKKEQKKKNRRSNNNILVDDEIDYESIQRDAALHREKVTKELAQKALLPYDSTKVSEQEAAQRDLDAEFATLLEEYDGYEDGELHPDYEGVTGSDDVDKYHEEFTKDYSVFIKKRVNLKANYSTMTKEDKERTLTLIQGKMERWQKQDADLDDILAKIDSDFQKKPKEKWDAESICSTYSNTENIPALIREIRIQPSRKSKIKITPGIDAPMSAYAKHKQERREAGAARAQSRLNMLGTVITEENEEEEEENEEKNIEEEEDDEEGYEFGANLGAGRSKNESKEDKKARKAAVKAMKAQSRQSKKQAKQLYKDEEIDLKNRHATNRLLGYTVKKLH